MDLATSFSFAAAVFLGVSANEARASSLDSDRLAVGQARCERIASRRRYCGLRTLPVTIIGVLLYAVAQALGAPHADGVSELFGDRVVAVAGAKSPVVRGDFDGDGKPDAAYFVWIAPGAKGKSIASDVQVVKWGHGEALIPQSSGHAMAIVLNGGLEKLLIVDFQSPQSGGFFDSPSWLDFAHWDKSPPPHSKKRASQDLKGYPCLGKSTKGDVLMFRDEAGIDEALAWTGKTFKQCIDPNDEP